jgi:hypothetical protein
VLRGRVQSFLDGNQSRDVNRELGTGRALKKRTTCSGMARRARSRGVAVHSGPWTRLPHRHDWIGCHQSRAGHAFSVRFLLLVTALPIHASGGLE